MKLSDKSMAILIFAGRPIGSSERIKAIEVAAEIWSWRAIEKKTEELVARGYIEPLKGGTACGNLTAKGLAALHEH